MQSDDLLRPNARERGARADALKNRQILLDTAARLFAEQSVDAVTMSEIAEAANVGKGTLYRHFTSKTELCHALLDQEQRELQNRVLTQLTNRHTTPRENLQWFLEQIATFVWQNLPLLYVIGDASAPPSLENPAHHWWRQTLRALLVRCSAAGDVEYWADVLYVMVDVATLRCQRDLHGFTLPRVIEGLRALTDRILPA